MTAESHPDKVVVTDVGNHQMWSSQRIHTTGPRSFVTSAGIGTLGSGISQAIGAQLVAPDRLVVAVEGDEGFYSCGPELRTAARYRLPIKVLVINNGGQCIVRQWTTHMFGGNDVGVIDHIDGVSDMDFVANAASYGVAGEKVSLKAKSSRPWNVCWPQMAPTWSNAWCPTKIVILGLNRDRDFQRSSVAINRECNSSLYTGKSFESDF